MRDAEDDAEDDAELDVCAEHIRRHSTGVKAGREDAILFFAGAMGDAALAMDGWTC